MLTERKIDRLIAGACWWLKKILQGGCAILGVAGFVLLVLGISSNGDTHELTMWMGMTAVYIGAAILCGVFAACVPDEDE